MQIFYNGLDSAQKAFWDHEANLGYVNLLVQKLVAEQYSVNSEEFVIWAINYLRNNPAISVNEFERTYYYVTAEPPFVWNYSGNNNIIIVDPNPYVQLNFQFELGNNYETLYPRFINMVKNIKTFVKDNPKVLTALKTYSGLTEQQILEHLTYGNGPKIVIEEMKHRFGYYHRDSGFNTIHIRASYVRGLESAQLLCTQEATAFLLGATVLHEYIHLGRTHNNISEGAYDFGYGFERDAFNVIVDETNAGETVIHFTKWF